MCRGGVRALELRCAGFPAAAAVDAACYSCAELVQGGWPLQQLLAAGVKRPSPITPPRCFFVTHWQVAPLQLARSGCALQQLRAAACDARQLLACGFTMEALAAAGCSATELRRGGCSAPQLLRVLSVAEAKRGGCTAGALLQVPFPRPASQP